MPIMNFLIMDLLLIGLNGIGNYIILLMNISMKKMLNKNDIHFIL